MQISTKISTQVILTQDELDEAVMDYVKAKAPLPADAKFSIDYQDAEHPATDGRDLTAIVDITGELAAPELPAKAPRQTRGPRNQGSNTPAAQASTIGAGANDDTVKPAISETPEDRQDPANPEPPFDVDTPVERTSVEEAKSEPVIVTSPLKIFPDLKSSAPPPPAAIEPDPATKAKSLFANLVKPTN